METLHWYFSLPVHAGFPNDSSNDFIHAGREECQHWNSKTSLSLPLDLISRWGWGENGWRWAIHETSFKLSFMFQCKEMFSFVEKLKKGSWINVQCIVILWCFVKFIQKKKIISPTKLSNSGMIKPSSPLKFLSRGLHTQPERIPCSEEFDPAANFSPFLFPPEIFFKKHLFPASREIKRRRPLWVWGKDEKWPWGIYSTENYYIK